MITRREFIEAGLGSVAAGAVLSAPGKLARGEAARVASGASLVPRSPRPARAMMVAPVQHLGSDEATAFAVMQGLINRSQPRVYLVYDTEDAFWLDWLRERGDVDRIEWMGRYDVFRRCRDKFKGCIVTDPLLPATVNVATLLAGLTDCLVLSPDLVDAFGLPVREDLRGRWKKSVDAYRWAYEQHFPAACPAVLAHMSPYSSCLRDYMAEFKVFTFWLSGTKDERGNEEVEFARELFLRVGPNKPVLGWWATHGRGTPKGIGEEDGVNLISEYGLFTDCMDWDGHCEGTSNVSVHSGTRATFRQKPAPPAPKLEDKVYYSFVRTDGDGTNFWRQEFLNRWFDAAHGQVPINWPVGPMASEFIPDIMDWFYKHASDNDYFMAAVSGIGYTHESIYGAKLPPEVREKAFDEYLRLTGEYMKRMDLHHIHTYKTYPDKLIERYTRVERLKGLFVNYNRYDDTTVENATTIVNGVPAFRSVVTSHEMKIDTWEAKARSAEDQLRRFTPPRRPAFLNFTLCNWTMGQGTNMEPVGVIQDIARRLSPHYMAVRADHLTEMCLGRAK